MSKFKTTLLRIVGRIKKMAAWWTAVGVAFIPLAVVLLVTVDNFSRFWASILMAIGVVSIIFGWVKALAEERQRRREGIVSLYILTSIAEKLGVDVNEVYEKLRKLIDGK